MLSVVVICLFRLKIRSLLLLLNCHNYCSMLARCTFDAEEYGTNVPDTLSDMTLPPPPRVLDAAARIHGQGQTF